jgi:uncharacterized protein (UPF0297 family)
MFATMTFSFEEKAKAILPKTMLTMQTHSFEEKGYSNFAKIYVNYANTFL